MLHFQTHYQKANTRVNIAVNEAIAAFSSTEICEYLPNMICNNKSNAGQCFILLKTYYFERLERQFHMTK